VLATAVAVSPSSAEVTAVAGSAFGAQASVTVLALPPTTLAAAPTVTLPATGGGPLTATLASVDLPGVLSTGLLSVSTVGGNLNSHAGFATTDATIADVNAVAGLLTADAVSTTCTSNGDGSTASTTLANAQLAGIGSLAVSPPPNTTIQLANLATITLNEQTRTDVVGAISTVTVTAVHIHLSGVVANGDISLAQSVCEVTGPDVLTTTPTTTTDPPATTPGDPGTPTAPAPGTPTAGAPTPTPATPRFAG
jgi:hypothetical protein